MAKKIAKKTKKAVRRSAAKKRPAPRKTPARKKAVGKVTHFYNHISVAIVKFNQKINEGTKLSFKGATTDFDGTANSMQYDHKPIATAPKGKEIGLKVKKRVREGDLIYLAGE